jgi:hypothetical protein
VFEVQFFDFKLHPLEFCQDFFFLGIDFFEIVCLVADLIAKLSLEIFLNDTMLGINDFFGVKAPSSVHL